MTESSYPKNFREYRDRYPAMFAAHEQASTLARESGPLDPKTTHLIQLGAAIALRSEGSVHSHTRRALEEGATAAEIHQVVNLMVSTAGFPTASAAFSWVNDVLQG